MRFKLNGARESAKVIKIYTHNSSRRELERSELGGIDDELRTEPILYVEIETRSEDEDEEMNKR